MNDSDRAIIALAIFMIFVVAMFTIAVAFGETTTSCLKYKSNHIVVIATYKINGCTWLAEQFMFNNSTKWNVDHDYVNIPVRDDNQYYHGNTRTYESWTLTK